VGGWIILNRELSFSYVGQRSGEGCRAARFTDPAFSGCVVSGQQMVGTLLHSRLASWFGEDFRSDQYQCWVSRGKECGLRFSSRTSTIIVGDRGDNFGGGEGVSQHEGGDECREGLWKSEKDSRS
jgi:hypothetical protein